MKIPFLSAIIHAFDTIIAPPFCEACSVPLTIDAVLCNACRSTLQPVVSFSLSITKTYSVPVYALTSYDGFMKRLIRAKHYGSITASRQLGQLLAEHHIFSTISPDIFIPVPLHWTRQWRRGYNQAQEMAHVLAKSSSSLVLPIVRRNRITQYQSRLHMRERADNVSSAFVVDTWYAQKVADKHIVIVDDLLTTGATVREVIRVLRPLRPASIIVLVAARAV